MFASGGSLPVLNRREKRRVEELAAHNSRRPTNCDTLGEMRNARRGSVVLALIALVSSCATPFPYDNFDHQLDSLELGIAFAPVGDAQQRAFTIAAMDELSMTAVRFSQTWSLREPTNDAWNWTPLTSRVTELRAAGKEILLILEIKDFPAWTDALSPAELESEFREYAAGLLALIGADLSYIQYGNEWNWEIDSYRSGSDDEFIALANILFDEVQSLPPSDRPVVLLGSLSIGALRGIAFAQDRIDNVYFAGEPLYGAGELAEADVALADEVPRMRTIISAIDYDAVDLHFYDDHWSWQIYLDAFLQLVGEAGKSPTGVPIVVSEFGGPHPEMEPSGENYRAERLIEYVHAIDALPVDLAFYFKLVEERGSDIAHPNSFLYDHRLRETPSLEVLRLFGEGL